MANKEKLSLDELLEKALVKDEDKPYEVPSNWVWTKLGYVTEIIMGQSPSGTDTTEDSSYMPLIGGASDMGELFPKVNRYTKKPTKKSQNNDIIISIRATLGRPIFSDGEYCLGRGVAAFRTNKINFVYIKWLLSNIEEYLYEIATGSTFAQVSKADLENLTCPLPPIPEQQRIVDTIKSLFEKLDRAKELVQNALDSFENRKSAILHKAFTGELTAKWRVENGVNFEKDWIEKKFCQLGELERGRSKHRPRNAPELFGGDYPFIQTGDVANSNMYIVEHRQTLSEFGLKQSKLFPKGTLCITIAANIGDVAILSYDCCFPDSVVGFTPNNQVDSKFIYYYMSVIKKEVEHNAPATAQKNINLKILSDIKIKTPPFNEQEEIVRILDNLLENEYRAKELCEVIDNINHMKKSILARAFRGELSTNNLSEESSVDLLKSILLERRDEK